MRCRKMEGLRNGQVPEKEADAVLAEVVALGDRLICLRKIEGRMKRDVLHDLGRWLPAPFSLLL
jgi:hypothetical protein